VTDAGLLDLRAFDQELGVIAELARSFPDPRRQGSNCCRNRLILFVILTNDQLQMGVQDKATRRSMFNPFVGGG